MSRRSRRSTQSSKPSRIDHAGTCAESTYKLSRLHHSPFGTVSNVSSMTPMVQVPFAGAMLFATLHWPLYIAEGRNKHFTCMPPVV